MAIMHETFPEAPIYTAAYLPAHTFTEFRSARVIPLPGSWLVDSENRLKALFPLWVVGFARLDLRAFDIVLSSTTWGAKFIPRFPSVRHTCYCYAPTRLLWKPASYEGGRSPAGPLTKVVALMQTPLRALDIRAMQRADRVATTCRNMSRVLASCYGVDARVIFPPVRVESYHVARGQGEFYLSVSRLISHKRIDLAVEACRRLGRKLVIVGEGPEAAQLRKLSGGSAVFLGRVPDPELRELYGRCRAVLFPSDEDYGLVPLEAQASGRPVIAYGSGGALETVIEGRTGVFFKEQRIESVMEAIEAFESMDFDPAAIRESVRTFSVDRFKEGLLDFVLGV